MSILLCQANSLTLPLADTSVHCCVTSPPYYAIRDYGVHGQLGLEAVPDCLGWATGAACGVCYVCQMVAVFREVKRVLRDDGVVFLNLGDSYSGSAHAGGEATRTCDGPPNARDRGLPTKAAAWLKPKNLLGMPWRLALALQADGWTLRQEMIWHKLNPMPESVSDRCTKAHESVFLLMKQARYYWDALAIREPSTDDMLRRAAAGHTRGARGKLDMSRRDGETLRGEHQMPMLASGHNRRSVWSIASESYSGAHFATMPQALVEPCIRAGTSAAGCCPHCQTPWARVVERGARDEPYQYQAIGIPGESSQRGRRPGAMTDGQASTRTLGFAPTCACPPHPPVPCIVLDPFVGSGTVPLVARRLGRHAVGCDLSWPYLHEQARARLSLDALAAWDGQAQLPRNDSYGDLPLFA